MATTTQNQDEERSRSMQGAATSQDPTRSAQDQDPRGQDQDRRGAMQRAATSPARRTSRSLGPIIPLSPFSMMWRVFADLARMIDPLMAGDADRDRDRDLVGVEWMPRLDVARHDDALVIRVDLPGISPEQVSISLSGNELVIDGERSAETSVAPWHSERAYGRFRRVIALPADVDPEAVEARFENGVLEVSLPVRGGGARARRIEIRTGDGASRPQAQEALPQEAQAQVQGPPPPRPELDELEQTADRERERERLGAPQLEVRAGEAGPS